MKKNKKHLYGSNRSGMNINTKTYMGGIFDGPEWTWEPDRLIKLMHSLDIPREDIVKDFNEGIVSKVLGN